jgi:nitrogen fixation NifU-like protein
MEAGPSKDVLHAVLLEHYKRPHNRRDLPDASNRGDGSNPLCGDQLEIALAVDDGIVKEAAFKGRGCSVCIASASLLTDCVTGAAIDDVRRLSVEVRKWSDGEEATVELPSLLLPLALVRGHIGRRRCMALAWEALADALR